MATINLYLDNRASSGDAPIKVRISHHGEKALISTGIKIPPECWNGDCVVNHPKRNAYNKILSNMVCEIEELADNILLEQPRLTATQLKYEIQSRNGTAKEKPKRNLFLPYYRLKATEGHSSRTIEIYQATERTIKKFDKAAERLTFDDISLDWLRGFDAFMAQTCATNTRSIHMRNIRTVLNAAIDDELTNNYPFRKFKIKQEKTIKRNLSVEHIRKIRDIELEPWLSRHRDVFMLSFYLCGINYVDLVHLTEIENGRINYKRRKTSKIYSIKVEPEAQEIFDRWKGEKHLLNAIDNVKDYRAAYVHFGTGIGRIAEMLGIKGLTSYYARHSWATIAAELDIPKETISAALGHSDDSVTDIYINFNVKKIDEANRKVLDYIK